MNTDTSRNSKNKAYFNATFQQFQGVFDDWLGSQSHRKQRALDRQIVERFVDSTNKKMRVVGGYFNKLRYGVRALYDHVHCIADKIPDPIILNHDSFRAEPLVNALFVSVHHIDEIFDRDYQVRKYYRTHHKSLVPSLYALLSVSKQEKRTLGVCMVGELVMRDVPQDIVNFGEHKIYATSTNSNELNDLLKQYLFDLAVEQAVHELEKKASASINVGNESMYASRLYSLKNPHVYLKEIVDCLHYPESLLAIEKSHFKLNKLGIKLDESSKQAANEFDIHELVIGNNYRSVVVPVFYNRLPYENTDTIF